jgi:hopanoid biosynthesis associated protein HpnK
MAYPEARRRLIVNADDFGRSHEINEAVIRAHREGILTTASLMVNEPAAEEAVAMARQNPALGVGLHLVLVCGRSALAPSAIPDLVNARSEFSNDPVSTGCRYFFSVRCRSQLRDELAAQFEKFRSFGLPLDHVNGHLHMHLHPAVFGILSENIECWNIRALRLTRDPFLLNARIASGRWLYRLSHAVIYTVLSARARPVLNQHSIRHTATVFGLLQNACVDSDYVAKLLPELPPGDSELYSHPSLHQFRNEFDTLVNPTIRDLVRQLGIQLIRYQDL